ncbi:bifunctional diguanylate cyclase/phosphodiesterase [Motilimonas cestriensis]|uniref:Bifunctional diguanylate cyclase/phosphodiesterase n=1 Tax=Motilimonas cestriensis TaxID=2742685 RepID=A0ABS8W6W7_9GAMM|nr:bifunctional diguanylate cyclase/phosphodiesterase [Motilimonas cestriensis]MCE2593276.1 bifunctional diguanylate cyclase/phosphodiesterase [Motilimonas cestriensis]
MVTINTTLRSLLSIKFWIDTFYYVAVVLIFYTLFSEHQLARYSYLFYPLLMLFAKHTENGHFRKLAAIFSLGLIVTGGIVDPLSLDQVEETFLLIPLTYIILFPSSLWPIASAFLILSTYFFTLKGSEFDEFIEDGIELITISSFASVMAYFQQKLKYQMINYRKESMTDYLTQLPNRKGFYYDIAQLKVKMESTLFPTALLQIDLDGFKRINDNMGHNIGDLVLKEFAQRLKSLESNFIRAYRIGGDEFAVVIREEFALEQEANTLSQRIISFADSPYHLAKREYHLTASIGIALYSDASGLNDIWCRNADIAMYRSKAQGKNTYHWFDHELIQETIRKYQLEQELMSALEQEQFYLLYQPKVDVKKGVISGVEALVRWKHPDLGVIPPIDFISIAEESQQIIALGAWVMQQSCYQGKRWLDAGQEVAISVNVSAVQLAHDDVYEMIKRALTEAALPGYLLQVEITESAIMENSNHIIDTFSQLRALGVKVAIDDFGVAYSSLNYLRRLPIDILKIDKSFVDDCVTNQKDRMIVRTVVQLGHNLGMSVTAEGVEDEAQLALLKTEGCDEYQGYLFSKPVSAPEISELLFSKR